VREHRRRTVVVAFVVWLGGLAGAAAQEKDRVLEEIVVTARRREENLQDVPVAVTGLGAEELERSGVHTITDLAQSVPSLQFGESGSKTPAIFIRGIGQREATAVLDPGVGVYINDIFIPRQDSQLLDTVDTESIQVLRGPQGTLFGKNTTGGAILITTRKPDLDHFDGAVSTRLGSFGRSDLMLRGNAPLVKGSMATRFAFNVTRQRGYLENEVDGHEFGDEDRIAATARWVWRPSDELTAELFGYWSRQDERSTALTCIFQNPESNLATLDWPALPDFKTGCDRSQQVSKRNAVSMNTESSAIRMSTGITALTVDWLIDAFEVKSVTGFNYWWGISRDDDLDATAIPIINSGTRTLDATLRADDKPTKDENRYQVSEELQLHGSGFGERLKYTIGGFGSVEKINGVPFFQVIGPKGLAGIRPSTVGDMVGIPGLELLDDTFRIPFPTLLGTQSDLDNQSAAVFAQGSYDLTSWLQLTVGGRYTWEHRKRDLTAFDVDMNQYCPRVGGVPLATTGLCSPITKLQFDALGENLPDLPLIVRPSADVRSQSWSEFTPSVTLSATAPEAWTKRYDLDSAMTYFTYSTGFKAGGFEPRGNELVRFEPEHVQNFELGFKMDLLDRRLRLNAAGYHMIYDDIQVRVAEQGAAITDIFLFLSNASKAQVTGGELEATLLLDAWLLQATTGYTWARYDEFLGHIVIPGQGAATVDRSNEPFGLVPKATVSLAAEYHWMTAAGMLVPRLSYYRRERIFTGLDEKAIQYESSFIDPVNLVRARLTWLYGDHLRVTGYVDNLLDEDYYASGFAVTAALGAATLVQAPQRSVGLEATFEF